MSTQTTTSNTATTGTGSTEESARCTCGAKPAHHCNGSDHAHDHEPKPENCRFSEKYLTPMNEELSNALVDQANHEFFAAHCYEALALWCAERDFNGFAEFFQQQADEEREHAHKFLEHLLDRGQPAKVTGMEAPRAEFAGIVEVAEHAAGLERQNTANIHNCYEIALDTKEFGTQPFLMEFIEEQVEEETWTGTMLTLTRRNECPGSLFDLDRHIMKVLGAKQ
jgi:ferritin